MSPKPELTTVPPGWAGYDEQGKGWYFHSRHGFHFRGRGDAVTIAVEAEGGYLVLTLPPNEWASVVAAVWKRGDVQSAFSEALRLHEADA